MTVAIPFLNPNQQEQTNVVGQLDLQGGRPAPVISGQVSANATGPIAAGSSVKLDTTNTGKNPQFLPCAQSDVAFGKVVFTERNANPAVGEEIEVAFNYAVMWVIADGTVTVGDLLEDGPDGPEFAQTLASNKQRGIALDSAVAGQLFRMLIVPSLT